MKKQINNRFDVHGGNIHQASKRLNVSPLPKLIFDFSVNLNPHGPPQEVKDFLSKIDFEKCLNYPESDAKTATKAIAKAHQMNNEFVLLANGSTEIFSATLRAILPKKAFFAAPCYSGYEEICRAEKIPNEYLICANEKEDFKFDFSNLSLKSKEMLFICNPNNPTGTITEKKQILELAYKFQDAFIAIDESFMDYAKNSYLYSLISHHTPKNIIVFKSLTKFFGIAGLRLGMMVADKKISEKVKELIVPWNVNSIAQEIAPLLYSDKKYFCEIRKRNEEEKKYLSAKLNLLGLKVFSSSTNFILATFNSAEKCLNFQREMLKKGFLLRDCSTITGLNGNFIRIAILDREKNSLLVEAANECLKNQGSIFSQRRKKTKSLMIVGTSSDSGKSLITAALCRIFSEKGFKVAPFKAQNMALNSFVSKTGGEIGRAQAFQAQCAGIDPETDMNPILLKPSGDSCCQVIANGKVFKTLSNAKNYYKINSQVRKIAFDAYDRLSKKFDIIMLEGAGSPAEINLLDRDFVNMAMAEYAGANAILVADIDRGGVFAQIYGTLRLLPEKWRKLVKWVIINKFRGDESLLKDGIERIEKLCAVKVIGVMPYIKNLILEEEDSLALERRISCGNSNSSLIQIAVIRYPRVSNYTDFLVFEKKSNCQLKYIERAENFGSPDIIFLPGTKNTRSDLEWMKENGIFEKIIAHYSKGYPIFGICGGFQMLGEKISDPFGIEGKAGESYGFGFLPMNTSIFKAKTLSRVRGKTRVNLPFCQKGTEFSGYEIHMGKSFTQSKDLLQFDLPKNRKNELSSLISNDGLVFGTYVHGFFDEDKISYGLLKWLSAKTGKNFEQETKKNHNSFDDFVAIFKKKIDISCLSFK